MEFAILEMFNDEKAKNIVDSFIRNAGGSMDLRTLQEKVLKRFKYCPLQPCNKEYAERYKKMGVRIYRTQRKKN